MGQHRRVNIAPTIEQHHDEKKTANNGQTIVRLRREEDDDYHVGEHSACYGLLFGCFAFQLVLNSQVFTYRNEHRSSTLHYIAPEKEGWD